MPQGPLALPATYQVRLTADGNVLTGKLTIKMDPRVDATRDDLAKLFALESKLAASVDNSAKAALAAHSIREQVDKLSESTAPPVPAPIKEELEKLDKQLDSLLKSSDKSANAGGVPGLDSVAGEISSLYGQVGQADAAPTSAQEQASVHTIHELSEVLPAWEQIEASSIPNLNRLLQAAHLPVLSLDEKPDTMPESGDED